MFREILCRETRFSSLFEIRKLAMKVKKKKKKKKKKKYSYIYIISLDDTYLNALAFFWTINVFE